MIIIASDNSTHRSSITSYVQNKTIVRKKTYISKLRIHRHQLQLSLTHFSMPTHNEMREIDAQISSLLAIWSYRNLFSGSHCIISLNRKVTTT